MKTLHANHMSLPTVNNARVLIQCIRWHYNNILSAVSHMLHHLCVLLWNGTIKSNELKTWYILMVMRSSTVVTRILTVYESAIVRRNDLTTTFYTRTNDIYWYVFNNIKRMSIQYKTYLVGNLTPYTYTKQLYNLLFQYILLRLRYRVWLDNFKRSNNFLNDISSGYIYFKLRCPPVYTNMVYILLFWNNGSYVKVILCAYEHIFLIVRYRYISFKQL